MGGHTKHKEWVTSDFSPQRTDFGDSTVVVTRTPQRLGKRDGRSVKEGLGDIKRGENEGDGMKERWRERRSKKG